VNGLSPFTEFDGKPFRLPDIGNKPFEVVCDPNTVARGHQRVGLAKPLVCVVNYLWIYIYVLEYVGGKSRLPKPDTIQ
jgi:hypothetical protein